MRRRHTSCGQPPAQKRPFDDSEQSTTWKYGHLGQELVGQTLYLDGRDRAVSPPAMQIHDADAQEGLPPLGGPGTLGYRCHQPCRCRSAVTCATWCRECQAYMPSIARSGMSPISGCT